MKPLIRILLRAGIPYLEFREVIKGAYVEAAVRDGIRGHKGSITRAMLSDYTGVSLADVNRFIDDDSLLAPPDTTNAAVITEVLHIWGTDPDYLGPYGLPLELDLEETPGRNLSTLVFRADPTADPRIVLRDMIENEIVKPVGERHFRASARSFLLPDIMTPQALEYFGRTITDLANTIEFNMKTDGESKRLQRSVVADGGLPDYALPEFEALLKEKVQKLQEKLKKEQIHDKWVYLVDKWSIDNLLKERREFMAEKKDENKSGEPKDAPIPSLPPGLELPKLN